MPTHKFSEFVREFVHVWLIFCTVYWLAMLLFKSTMVASVDPIHQPAPSWSPNMNWTELNWTQHSKVAQTNTDRLPDAVHVVQYSHACQTSEVSLSGVEHCLDLINSRAKFRKLNHLYCPLTLQKFTVLFIFFQQVDNITVFGDFNFENLCKEHRLFDSVVQFSSSSSFRISFSRFSRMPPFCICTIHYNNWKVGLCKGSIVMNTLAMYV